MSSAFIEKVTYTASLVTRAEDIDKLLDPLRVITARSDPSKDLSSDDVETLKRIQVELESYLVTKEKIRSFTLDSLHLQITQHMEGKQDNTSLIQLWIVVITAIIFAGIAANLPLHTIQEQVQAGGATAFSVLTVGAASLFLTALPAFRSALRQRFMLICAGVTLLGLSLLGQPIMEIFHLRQYSLTSILYSVPILIAAILFHIGNARYVRLIGVKNFWTTATPIVVGGIFLSLVTWFMPHPPTSESEFIHDITAIIWAWMLLMPVTSAIILPMAIKKLPELYRPPIRLLFYSMFPIITVVSYQYIVRIIAGPYMEGPVAYVLFSLVIIMGIGLLRAGYSFHKVSRY
jgi:hypothetical protein